ncbi:MAG: hypothetical protein KDA83_02080 [Planctomycetales bacterium]|nr:hypothetical protein [Planctomycetales bacterium]
MRLDQTYIRIRERSIVELVDLTFLMMRAWWRPLVWLGFLGALPWIVFNLWILEPAVLYPLDYDQVPLVNVILHFCLVATESQLAMILVTAYLGRRVFEPRPSKRDVVKHVWRERGAIFVVLGLRRLVLPYLGIVVLMKFGEAFSDSASSAIAAVFLCFLLVIIHLPILMAPFSPEVVLLERPRGRTQTGGSLLNHRLRRLHQQSSGFLMVRFIVANATATLLTLSLFYGLGVLWGYTFGEMVPRFGILTFVVPIAMWTREMFVTVFRFAGYIDARIRQEGWEIELLMKTEARAMEQAVSPALRATSEAT